MRVLQILTAAALALWALNVLADDHAGKGTVIEVARDAGGFEALLTAIEAAGLTETLAGEGPFTVFAPTDEAFAALPDGALEGLLANPEALAEVLTYHVVPGRAMAVDVTELASVETVQGDSLSISMEDGLRVEDARVVTTDIEASNGVIHVIDSVLLP